MISIWETRLQETQEMLLSGKTLVEVGEYYGVSKQRIDQVIRKHLPELTKEQFGASKKRSNRINARADEIQTRFNRETYSNLSDLERAQSAYFTRKKQSAKSTKWEWDITMSDLMWPSHCPILGIELDWFAEKRQENSPSIDRIDSTIGYLKDNVCIMSWRANRIKNNGTREEHQLIADFLSSLGH